jgi:pimeloyl-ACP methyl ester carboxylesterase
MVAMNWTSRYPQDFKRAVLINSSGAGVSPVYRRMLPANYPGVASMFFKNTLERERTVLELTTHLQGEKLEARARTQAGFAIPVKSRDGIAQITAALVFKTPETLPVPTLILTAKGDRLVDWRCSDDLARRFGAELRIHPTGNHDLSVDDPAWIAREVSDWTRRNPV